MDHEWFIRRCLELAGRGRGRVGNGALVGAVLVRGEKILAEAWYERFGAPHAERTLLERFSGEIKSEDTLYVNLEPCCHEGKTPPCTDSIIERGIRRVAFGMVDPDARVSGEGIQKLREAGVEVIGPLLRTQCEWLNRGFISLRTRGRPFVTLKRAQTRDGAIAKRDGSALKITSQEQDVWSHTFLRGSSDAILVGVETVILDGPQLTPRLANTRFVQEVPKPYRVILDPHTRLPLSARVVSDAECNRTIVVTAETKEITQELTRRGVSVVTVPLEGDQFSWEGLFSVLTTPSGNFPGIATLLVEGGARTWQAFQEAGYVDEEVILVGS